MKVQRSCLGIYYKWVSLLLFCFVRCRAVFTISASRVKSNDSFRCSASAGFHDLVAKNEQIAFVHLYVVIDRFESWLRCWMNSSLARDQLSGWPYTTQAFDNNGVSIKG
jgi:hypothetical protein